MKGLFEIVSPAGLFFRLGFSQADDAIAVFPLAAFAEQFNALEALEDGAVLFTPAAEGLETIVLGHAVAPC